MYSDDQFFVFIFNNLFSIFMMLLKVGFANYMLEDKVFLEFVFIFLVWSQKHQ